MALVKIAHAFGDNGGNASVNSSSLSVGEHIALILYQDITPLNVSLPSGWSPLTTLDGNGGGALAISYKQATASDIGTIIVTNNDSANDVIAILVRADGALATKSSTAQTGGDNTVEFEDLLLSETGTYDVIRASVHPSSAGVGASITVAANGTLLDDLTSPSGEIVRGIAYTEEITGSATGSDTLTLNVSAAWASVVAVFATVSPPTAAPGGPYETKKGQAIQFDGSASEAGDGGNLTYSWTLADNTVLTGENPTLNDPQMSHNGEVSLVVSENGVDSPAVSTRLVVNPIVETASIDSVALNDGDANTSVLAPSGWTADISQYDLAADEALEITLTVSQPGETPQITNKGTASTLATINEEYTHTVTFGDADNTNAELTLSLVSGPVNLDQGTGVVTYTPTTYDEFSYTVRVTDPLGLYDEETVTVSIRDTIAPSRIVDLVATGTSATDVQLDFTAPGDDDESGIATAYQIRVSNTPIFFEQDWENAEVINNNFTPLPAGVNQSFVISSIPLTGPLHFNVRGVDESGNIGPLSNAPQAPAFLLPERAGNFQSVTVGSRQILHAWDPVSGADFYRLHGDVEGVAPSASAPTITTESPIIADNINDTVYLETVPTDGLKYTRIVVAVSNNQT